MEERLERLYKEIKDILSVAPKEDECTFEESEAYYDMEILRDSLFDAGYGRAKNAIHCKFVSVWDDFTTVETRALFNADTGRILYIQQADEELTEGLENLIEEYVLLKNGVMCSVTENENNEYYVTEYMKD